MEHLHRFASFFSVDVNAIVQHVLHLIQTEGQAGLDAVYAGISLVKSVRAGDYSGIFAALAKEQTDLAEIEAAIKTEFGIQ